ncbi:MAG: trypsin-like serine protease with C-terminal domain [Actinomycetia bacterium]|nr:trypsin-like serine protease with C-terminal domain [Actinomycetes bacterium]
MSDQDLPGDERGDAEVPASEVEPGSQWSAPVGAASSGPEAGDPAGGAAPDSGLYDDTVPGMAVPPADPTSELPAEPSASESPAGPAGWGAESGPVPAGPAEQSPTWVATQAAPPIVPGPPAAGPPPARDRDGRSRNVLVGAIAGALVGALVSSGVFLAVRNDSGSHTVTTVVEKTAKPASSVIKSGTDIHAVIAKVQPATVAITTGSAVSSAVPLQDGSQFNSQQTGAAGTGFIISSDGYVVTNNHVIADAGGRIEVTFDSGSSKSAKVVGADSRNDIAVLKVDGVTDLPTVQLGNSSELTVGDDVIAIGNALALEGGPTVTRGIVSGLNRTIDTEAGTLTDAVQTDASINHGNSGGPLVNSRGQVIGIVDAIADPSTNQNVDFAIAIDHAKPVIETLKAGKKVQTAYMGVSGQTLDSSLASSLKLKVATGVLVHAVTSGSPADSAGIKKDDVLQSVDGKKLVSAEDLVAAVRNHQPGDKVTFKLDRSGTAESITVTLAQMPNSN